MSILGKKRWIKEKSNLADHLFIWQTRGESYFSSRSPWLVLLSKRAFLQSYQRLLGAWAMRLPNAQAWVAFASRELLRITPSCSHLRLMRVLTVKETRDVSPLRSVWLWELQVWESWVSAGCRGSVACGGKVWIQQRLFRWGERRGGSRLPHSMMVISRTISAETNADLNIWCYRHEWNLKPLTMFYVYILLFFTQWSIN